MKKFLALLLALTMVLAMAACGNNSTPATDATEAPKESSAPAETEAPSDVATAPALTGDYDADSAALYDYVLGDFYAAYQEATAVDEASEAWAKMALAEAKLLESGVLFPMTANGGRYAIGRVAPYTVTPVGWGLDQDRYHYYVVTEEFLKASDRAALKEKYAELKGTGEYRQAVIDYLTENGYHIKDNFNMQYATDPQTWDMMATSRAADSNAITYQTEMLMWYDGEGTQQPGLAESYTVSDDGLTYTFKLREGLIWTDSQGRKVGDVTADDFVAGFQHMMDAQGGLEFLVDGRVVGAHEYIAGQTTDMSTVGVKAVDDYTVEYTLEAPCRFFLSMLGYNPFAPMNRAFYESKGGKFGADFDSSAADYTYGTSPDNVAYCGPYLVTNATAENTIVYEANPNYWNADAVLVKTMTWRYNDGTDVTKAYNDALNNLNDSCALSTAVLEIAKADGNFDEYAYVVDTGTTSYMGFLNVNRAVYANVSDETVAVSPKTDDQKAVTYAALLNRNFRNALMMGADRATYAAQRFGEDLRLNCLRNSYTPGNFLSLSEDVTVDINGTSTTFPAGTNYGAIMQAQLDADGFPVTVWDPSANDGLGSSDGFDGWYNPENAKAYLQKAVEELAAQGVEVSKENPVTIDLPTFSGSETFNNMAVALKKSIEDSLDGYVVLNLVECATSTDWYNAGYYTDFGNEANYDLYDVSGWGPDYGDPTSYLDTFLPDYAGYMVKCIGLF